MGRKNPNVTNLLQKIHSKMQSQYFPKGRLAEDKKNAQILQNFLMEIKEHAMTRGKNPTENFQKDIYDLILDNIVLPNGRTIGKLFTRIGKINKQTGQYFEDDLAAVISSVVNLAENRIKNKSTYKNFSLGNIAGTTSASYLEQIPKDISEEYIKSLVNVTKEELDNNQPGLVMGKIDTVVNQNIINLNAAITFPKGVLEALSNATFTDKSYRSMHYDKLSGQLVQIGDKTIHLGNSNPYRAILGTMSKLGFSELDAQYIFYGGRNIFQGLDKDNPPENPVDIKQHIYHLRYIYELTGAGILYRDYGSKFSSGAKYIVYNDPDSSLITVVATAEIINNIINSEDFPNDPFGAIGVKTSALVKMANVQL